MIKAVWVAHLRCLTKANRTERPIFVVMMIMVFVLVDQLPSLSILIPLTVRDSANILIGWCWLISRSGGESIRNVYQPEMRSLRRQHDARPGQSLGFGRKWKIFLDYKQINSL